MCVVPLDAEPGGPELTCPSRVEVQGAGTEPAVLVCDVDMTDANGFVGTQRWRWAIHNSNSKLVYLCNSESSCLKASAYVELMDPIPVCFSCRSPVCRCRPLC